MEAIFSGRAYVKHTVKGVMQSFLKLILPNLNKYIEFVYIYDSSLGEFDELAFEIKNLPTPIENSQLAKNQFNEDTSTTELGILQAQLPHSIVTSAISAANSINNPDTLNFKTLEEVWTWVTLQDHFSIATLRRHLLPLDLLPGAFIDEVNERTLDAVGDIALKQSGDVVFVAKDVIQQMLAAKDSN